MNSFDVLVFQWLNSWAGVDPLWDFLIVFRGRYFLWVFIGGILIFPFITLFKNFFYVRAKNIELAAYALLAGFIAQFGVVEIIRFFYDRPRPFEISNVVQLIQHSGGGSFPSGHASVAFAAATAISFYYPRTSIIFFLAAFSIGLGRVAAGVHWPSDILGGALAGVATAWVVRLLIIKSLKKITAA